MERIYYLYLSSIQGIFLQINKVKSISTSFLLIASMIDLRDFKFENFESILNNSIQNIDMALYEITKLRQKIREEELGIK